MNTNNSGARSALDDVLPDYQPISKAPDAADLAAIAQRTGVSLEEVMNAERRKKYKALDNVTGGVYLIQNPAAWTFDGKSYNRPEPEYQCSIGEARKYGGGVRTKKTGSAGEWF